MRSLRVVVALLARQPIQLRSQGMYIEWLAQPRAHAVPYPNAGCHPSWGCRGRSAARRTALAAATHNVT